VTFGFLVTALLRTASSPVTVGDRPNVEVSPAVAAQEDRAASPFSLPAVAGGGSVTGGGPSGQVTVMNFWASWCGPCEQEAPELQAVWSAYRDRGVRFVGIDQWDDRPSASSFLDQHGVGYPSGFDRDGSLGAPYRLVGLPTTLVVDRAGRIRYRLVGPVERRTLSQAVEDVLRNGEG